MAIASVDSRVQKFKDLYSDSMNKDLATINQTAESQKQVINDTYGKSIDDTKASYEDELQKNLIQKYINERQIAENMANYGLTKSGLNETNQTAVQLSYANNKAKIERAMNSAVENFRLEMNSKLTDIENNRISNESTIRQNYDSVALSAAQDEYDTEYEAEVEKYKSDNEAATAQYKAYLDSQKSSTSNLLSYSRTTQDDYGNSLNVYRNSDGKEIKVKTGTNPYTSTNNTVAGNGNKKWADVRDNTRLDDAQKAVALYGTFDNGYQPKGVVYDNKHYGKLQSKVGTTDVFGKTQNVWATSGSTGVRYWIWYGAENRYIQIDKNSFDTDGTIKVV